MAEPSHPSPLDPAELGFETIVYDKSPPRATIRLNRPDVLNAFDFRMLREIARACEDASWDDDTRVVVVTGEGRAFCSGADVTRLPSADPEGERAKQPWRPPHWELQTHEVMRRCNVPVIGAVNSYAIGLGFGLALATDLRIAADDARFQVTQVKRGLFGDFGIGHLLPQLVGPQHALELMFTGRMIDAQRPGTVIGYHSIWTTPSGYGRY